METLLFPTCIGSLPTELLGHIFSFLGSPAPSDTRLHDQPTKGMLESDDKSLKTASTVCKRWRNTILPLLFRHVIWNFDRWDLLLVEQEDDPKTSISIVNFLRDNDLGKAVRSFAMLVSDGIGGFYSIRRNEGESSTVSSGMLDPGKLTSIRMADGSMARRTIYAEDNNWLWEMLFELIDPLRFTIIASPRMLTSLLSRMLFEGDSRSFQVPYHILSLSRKDRSRRPAVEELELCIEENEEESGEVQASSPSWLPPGDSEPLSRCSPVSKRVPCNLMTIRPWTSLLLNEGSSLRVYKTYEFFLKRTPSILGALLGAEEAPNNKSLIPSSVREMAYVGIFPLSNHFNTLVKHLPRLDKLFVQLVPRNNILNDKEEMRNVEAHDLWMERNTSYSLIMREILVEQTGNWAHLCEFESGDAADQEAWGMAVQYVRMSGNGWRIGGEGVFVKRDPDDPADSSDEASYSFDTEAPELSDSSEHGGPPLSVAQFDTLPYIVMFTVLFADEGIATFSVEFT